MNALENLEASLNQESSKVAEKSLAARIEALEKQVAVLNLICHRQNKVLDMFTRWIDGQKGVMDRVLSNLERIADKSEGEDSGDWWKNG